MAKEDGLKKRKASVSGLDTTKKKVKEDVVNSAKTIKRKASDDVRPVVVKKSKTNNAKEGTENPSAKLNKVTSASTSKIINKKANGNSKAKVLETPAIPEDEHVVSDIDDNNSDEDDEIDDQTAALLEGFESDEEEMTDDMPALKKGNKVPVISAEAKKALKKSKKNSSQDSDKPGVVYVGRIPHGFYENEMREYFKQFGNILRLRMSRNKKTGSSRHFSFIEFESAEVAEIVAKTMDNYLMFNHILKVKLIPEGQIHENMFIGANKRFKKVPWNKLRGRELEQGASEEQWRKRIDKENQRRAAKADKMKQLGYEFEAPEIKSPEGIVPLEMR